MTEQNQSNVHNIDEARQRDVEEQVNTQIQQARMYRFLRSATLCRDEDKLEEIAVILTGDGRIPPKAPTTEVEFDLLVQEAMARVPL